MELLSMLIEVGRWDCTDFLIMSRLACLRELKIKKAECIIKDIKDDDAVVFIIESNRQRVKTARQQLNEAKYLSVYYGNQQGKRNDLLTSGESPEVRIETRVKVANEVD